MRVIGYMRVSTEGQAGEDKFGIDAQRMAIEDYCQKQGHEIVAWYIDQGVSGATEDRPEFGELLHSDLDDIGAVIVAKSDRIARDVYIYFAYKNELRKKGVQVISVAEDFGELGAYAVILDSMLAAIAEVERRNINHRTSSGRKVKASKGGYSGGKVPYGYSVDNHALVIEPKEAEIVRIIFKLRDKGYSTYAIADALTRHEVVNRGGKPFTKSSIYSILCNENTYKGLYKYGDSGWVIGKQEAII